MNKEYTMEEALEAIIDYRGRTPKKSDSGILTLSAKVVKNNFIDYDNCYRISNDEYKNYMVRGFPKKGDILLTTEAPLGQVACLDREDVAIAQRLLTLRGKSGVLDNNYLLYFLQSSTGQKLLSAKESGSTVTGIKQSEFRKIKISLPEYNVQKIIGKTLKNFDDKIAINNKIIRYLESFAKDLYDYWFLQFEFPNENEKPYKSSGGKMVWNDELKREIPEGWVVSDLSSYIKTIRGVSYDKDEISSHPIEGYVPLLKSNNVQGNKILYEDLIYVNKSKVSVDQTLDQNSILITMSSGSTEHVGKTALCSYDNVYTYGAFCSKILIDPSCRCFLSMFFTSDYFKNKIRTIVVGTNIKNISNSHLTNNHIPFPNKNVLSKFESTITPLLDKRAILVKENQELASLRDFLLPMLMNGQVTFKD